jgi:hypothetical protein
VSVSSTLYGSGSTSGSGAKSEVWA